MKKNFLYLLLIILITYPLYIIMSSFFLEIQNIVKYHENLREEQIEFENTLSPACKNLHSFDDKKLCQQLEDIKLELEQDLELKDYLNIEGIILSPKEID
jgi:hypothetical protein